jgi:phosphatidylserine/phosphatidylglycerophosphate/cardiolipin synthase-like enzyme
VVTRDTKAVVHTLIEECRSDILLVGYAIHHGRDLFQRLGEKLAADPSLRVRFFLNVHRTPGNASTLAAQLVQKFATEFATWHWPWRPRPEVWYDPRSLQLDPKARAVLHAKCLIVDAAIALVTSANFTEAAQERNIEVGIIIRDQSFIQRLTLYFEGLRQTCLLPLGSSSTWWVSPPYVGRLATLRSLRPRGGSLILKRIGPSRRFMLSRF